MEVELYKMIYKKENEINNIRILGEEFIINKNKGVLVVNNKKKKFPLNGIISFNQIKNNKIKMLLKKYIYNKSCLFRNCENLETLSQLNIDELIKLKEEEINENSEVNQYNEKIIENQKDESSESINFDDAYSNYFSRSSMFNTLKNSFCAISEISGCKEEIKDKKEILYSNKNSKDLRDKNYSNGDNELLSFLSGISKLKTQNIIDVSYMFSNCKSLSFLNDIPVWNGLFITNMAHMFSNCKSLQFLPNISN